MRIISGTAGRMAIRVPGEVTRPTTDFVRQALFSILGEKVEGARVADLFAGSGALGLEALSRGAASCEFVEQNRKAVGVIRSNLEKTRLSGGLVTASDVHPWAKRSAGGFDLVFADPPYAKSKLDRDHLAELLGKPFAPFLISEEGWWVVEQSADSEPPVSEGLELLERRVYGSSAILLYGRKAGI
ncbi:16S rRNA (guanine966-N2)-methyltransferase [Haloferula luteola]|uniref:16S rRNA (Guanine966-N2)-methyltransferase n=1 Tax=Haloferula luteola TaxID=595692 RepID=A0A840V5J1_9BACT|nr:16S rRNA (guanine(966)-N(2))-methyltransferase RsmD [Haloferula luteola]MBB5352296.1 16S rRNA (guanine966-N2)-methyltransferase [Haloferula luteola]